MTTATTTITAEHLSTVRGLRALHILACALATEAALEQRLSLRDEQLLRVPIAETIRARLEGVEVAA